MIQALAIAAIALPALAVVLWPLLRAHAAPAEAPEGMANALGGDRRLELAEERDTIYRALKELAFDHEAGQIEDDDYRELRARDEGRAAEVLRALDALEPATRAAAPPTRPVPAAPSAQPGRSPVRSPAALAAGGLLVLVFGVVLGLNIGRFTEPDRTAGPPAMTAGAPVGSPGSAPAPGGPGPGKAIAPEMLAGMLRAARQALTEGHYDQAIAAYKAVLARDADNVDAMTHLGLIVAIGGHADAALETWDKALRLDPDYAPAHLYRGEVLYEVKRDYPAAIRSWKRFLALVPTGQERDRVVQLIREAEAKPATR